MFEKAGLKNVTGAVFQNSPQDMDTCRLLVESSLRLARLPPPGLVLPPGVQVALTYVRQRAGFGWNLGHRRFFQMHHPGQTSPPHTSPIVLSPGRD